MTMSSNVIPISASTFPEVRTASVSSYGQQLQGSRNDVWVCPAYTGAGTVMLYVKPRLTVRRIVAELVASQVGISMGLPCPQPYLVSVAPHLIGGTRGPSILTFGCEQAGPRSVAFPIRDLDLMMESLRRAKCAERAAVFDELIANAVRGPGDIVFDPEGQVWFIDHEASLEGGVAPDAMLTNWLAFRLAQELSISERTSLLARLKVCAAALHEMRFGRMPPEMGKLENGPRLYRDVIEFLVARLSHLDSILSQRVLPEQMTLKPLADSTPPANDAVGTTSL